MSGGRRDEGGSELIDLLRLRIFGNHRGDDPRQAFTEDSLRARRVQTAEATGMQLELHGDALPREICHGTHIATMYPTRWMRTAWAARGQLLYVDDEHDLCL
jgi:hypothetical protein